MPRKSKKEDYETTITIKVPNSLKEAFVMSCKGKDTNTSREFREFMRRYVAKNSQQQLL